MIRIIHKTSLHFLGWIFIALGFAGLVLPILPGIIFLGIGVYFLSLASERLALKVDNLRLRYPRFGRHYDIFDKKVSRYFKRAY